MTHLSLKQQIGQMVVVRASGYLFDHQIRYPSWEASNEKLQFWLEDLNLGGVGNTGDINIDANSLFLDNSFILSDNFGTGNAGDVTVNIAGDTTLINLSIIFSQVQQSGEGNAGSQNTHAS